MSEEPVLKIKFDQPTVFKFQAAYKAYSELFDESTETDERRILNDSISKLYGNEISYIQFYKKIDQCRDYPGKGWRFHRTKIKGKRKWAYRRDQQEKNRLSRHKR